MASTFASNTACWRVRVNGANTNGGGFDPQQASAGMDYTDSDSPVTSGTTGVVLVASATTFNDASANFPADIVGNIMQISARTGGSAASIDYYIITARASATQVTLDRAAAAGADLTACTWAVGGAFLNLQPLATGGSGSGIFVAPSTPSPLLIGNTNYIRGDGTLDPSTNTYDWSAGTWNFVGNTPLTANFSTSKVITLAGYNGRPRIAHSGGLINAGTGGATPTSAGWDAKHVSFFRKLSTLLTPVIDYASGAVGTLSNQMTDCIFDGNNIDASEYWGVGNFILNEVRSTGATTSGTKVVVAVNHPGCAIVGNYIHGVRGPAISNLSTGSFLSTTHFVAAFNTIVGCFSDCIQVAANEASLYNAVVIHNTCVGSASSGNGMTVATKCMSYLSCFNNIFVNFTASSTFAVKFVDPFQVNVQLQKHPFEANCYFGNTNDFNTVSAVVAWAHSTNDIQADPGFASAGTGNYKTGVNVKSKGLSGLGGVAGTLGTATNKLNIGAYQGPAGSSGHNLLTLVGVG